MPASERLHNRVSLWWFDRAGDLMAVPSKQLHLKLTIISHHFTDKACQILKYCDMGEF